MYLEMTTEEPVYGYYYEGLYIMKKFQYFWLKDKFLKKHVNCHVSRIKVKSMWKNAILVSLKICENKKNGLKQYYRSA